MTPKDLEKIFKSNLIKSKIVACYMTSSECGKYKSFFFVIIVFIILDQEKVVFEYIQGKNNFSNFLYRREKALDAVL